MQQSDVVLPWKKRPNRFSRSILFSVAGHCRTGEFITIGRINYVYKTNVWIAFEPPSPERDVRRKCPPCETHMTKGAGLINRKQKYIKTHSILHLGMSAFITNEPLVSHSCVNPIATTTFYIWLKFAIKLNCLCGWVRVNACLQLHYRSFLLIWLISH